MRAQDFTKTRVHFEMASFVDPTLLQELSEHVIPYADSLGMNEQELPNLYSILAHGNVSYVADSNPRIATVLGEREQNKCPFYGTEIWFEIEKKCINFQTIQVFH